MKDKSILINAGVDYEEGLERFSGCSQIYEKYLKMFLNDGEYSKLCVAMKEEKVEDAFRAAHTLKGVVGNLSINELFESIKPFVELLRSGNLQDAKKMFPTIKEKYEITEKAFKDYFEE